MNDSPVMISSRPAPAPTPGRGATPSPSANPNGDGSSDWNDSLTRNPDEAYRQALRSFSGSALRSIHTELGLTDPRSGHPAALSQDLASFWSEPGKVDLILAGVSHEARMALSLFGLWDVSMISLSGLSLTLGCLGVAEPFEPVKELVKRGLLAAKLQGNLSLIPDLETIFLHKGEVELRIAPSVLAKSATVLPLPPLAPIGDVDFKPVRSRTSDGLESILRLAAVWQRLEEGSLRRTQSGALYKRDRDRLADDPAIAGAIADYVEPLADMTAFWLGLAVEIELAVVEVETEKIGAAPAAYWAEHAVHLPQMLAVAWMRLPRWHERLGSQDETSTAELAIRYVRSAILLWLASLEPEQWTTLELLHNRLSKACPDWDRLVLIPPPEESESASDPNPAPGRPRKPTTAGRVRSNSDGSHDFLDERLATLSAVVFGPAFQLQLVECGEDEFRKPKYVRLTPLGRYALRLGSPPPPIPTFDQFLYVQPNFETIAYRQGLNASAIGQLSRFLRWVKIGSALELKLTPQSVYQGLQGGMTNAQMIERLERHGSRALAPAVLEAIRSWSARREKVTLHASATLMEFATEQDLEAAVAQWTTDPPRRVSSRLLLIEDANKIPFQKFRLTGSRDYRLPLEPCVDVEPDGIHLSLDLSRSDLMVDAELARFAVEAGSEGSKRRYRVTPETIAAAVQDGMVLARLERWFRDRVNQELTPAIRMLFLIASQPRETVRIQRDPILRTSSPEILNGLLQHPVSKPYIGERLGPVAAIVEPVHVERLRQAIAALGISGVNLHF